MKRIVLFLTFGAALAGVAARTAPARAEEPGSTVAVEDAVRELLAAAARVERFHARYALEKEGGVAVGEIAVRFEAPDRLRFEVALGGGEPAIAIVAGGRLVMGTSGKMATAEVEPVFRRIMAALDVMKALPGNEGMKPPVVDVEYRFLRSSSASSPMSAQSGVRLATERALAFGWGASAVRADARAAFATPGEVRFECGDYEAAVARDSGIATRFDVLANGAVVRRARLVALERPAAPFPDATFRLDVAEDAAFSADARARVRASLLESAVTIFAAAFFRAAPADAGKERLERARSAAASAYQQLLRAGGLEELARDLGRRAARVWVEGAAGGGPLEDRKAATRRAIEEAVPGTVDEFIRRAGLGDESFRIAIERCAAHPDALGFASADALRARGGDLVALVHEVRDGLIVGLREAAGPIVEQVASDRK